MRIGKNRDVFDAVAEILLNEYGMSDTHKVELLQLSENITYLVRNKSTNKKEYVLRVGRPGYHSARELQSELAWIREIQDYTPLVVASPVPAETGKSVVEAYVDNALYSCVMFEFLKGRAPDETDERKLVKEFEMLGETTAYLHKQARMWNKAFILERFVWDYDTMIGEHPRWGRWQQADGMTPEISVMLERASKVIKKRLENYGKDKERFGLIHADLRLSNLLVEGDVIKVIDFDDCGFGWYLHDMAAAVSFIEDRAVTPSLIDAWKTGYTKVECLTYADDVEGDTFIMQRRMQLLAWITSHIDSDPVKGLRAGFLDGTAGLAEKYLTKFC